MTRKKKDENGFIILTASRQEIFLRGMKSLLNQFWRQAVVIQSQTIDQLLSEGNRTPMLTIIDIDLAGSKGIELIEEIKTAQANARILVFSELNEIIYGVPYLKSGASGYLRKNTNESEIVTAITCILAGGRYSSKYLKEHIVSQAIGNIIDNPYKILSGRELEIAILLISGIGVMEISKKLKLQMGTVSTYKKRIFRKLEVGSIIELDNKMSVYGDKNKMK